MKFTKKAISLVRDWAVISEMYLNSGICNYNNTNTLKHWVDDNVQLHGAVYGHEH